MFRLLGNNIDFMYDDSPLNGFYILFFIIFGIVILVMISSIISSLITRAKNDALPRLKSQARIVSKRMDVNNSTGITHSKLHGYRSGRINTNYYITFEFEQGSRQEFQVDDYEYGILIEGDSGILEHQGSRYLGFERIY